MRVVEMVCGMMMMMVVVLDMRIHYFLRPVSSAVRDILRWRPPM